MSDTWKQVLVVAGVAIGSALTGGTGSAVYNAKASDGVVTNARIEKIEAKVEEDGKAISRIEGKLDILLDIATERKKR